MEKKIKIGLDFHGVITQNPLYFSKLTQQAQQLGYEIHIITGGKKQSVIQDLERWQIQYNYVFSLLDYYEEKGEVCYDTEGNFHVSDKLWDQAKADYCRKHQINIHIDDSQSYGQWFKTPFCCYQRDKQICHINEDMMIDLNESPQQVLKQMQKVIGS